MYQCIAESYWEVLEANITSNLKGRLGLWRKVQEAFRKVHQRYRGTYDWVLKADDDT
jgi:hypothetical protein